MSLMFFPFAKMRLVSSTVRTVKHKCAINQLQSAVVLRQYLKVLHYPCAIETDLSDDSWEITGEIEQLALFGATVQRSSERSCTRSP